MIVIYIIIAIPHYYYLMTVGCTTPGPLADMNNQSGCSCPLGLWVSLESPPPSAVGSHCPSIEVGVKAETHFCLPG